MTDEMCGQLDAYQQGYDKGLKQQNDKYEKLLTYIRLLREVEDQKYPFHLMDRGDILIPTDFLQQLGEK